MTFVWNDVWLKWRLFEKTFVWKDVCLKLRLFKSFLWTFFVQNFIYSKQLLFDPLLFFNNLYLTRSVQIPFFWIYHFCHDLQPFFSYVRFNWCHIWTNINFEQMLFDSLLNKCHSSKSYTFFNSPLSRCFSNIRNNKNLLIAWEWLEIPSVFRKTFWRFSYL